MDRADLRYLSKYNDQYNYALNVRHIFTLCLERTTDVQEVTSITAAIKFLFKIESQVLNNQTNVPSLLMQPFMGILNVRE